MPGGLHQKAEDPALARGIVEIRIGGEVTIARIESAGMDIAGEETFEPRPERRVSVDRKRHLEQTPVRWPPPADRRGPRPVAPDVYAVALGRGVPASNVHLVRSGDSWVLIDAGWAGDAGRIRRAAESLFGAGARPAAILLTHIHPDHSGAAGDLARSWEVPVYVHPDELPMAAGKYLPEFDMPLDHWVVMPIMRLLPARTRSRIEAAGDITDVTHPLEPAGVVPGLPEWEWTAAPGHTPGSVAFLRRRDGVLVSGDAVLTVDLNSVSGVLRGRMRLAGPPWYTTWQRQLARRSVAALAALEPRVLAPGHGYPLAVRTTEALRALADDERSRVRRAVDAISRAVRRPVGPGRRPRRGRGPSPRP